MFLTSPAYFPSTCTLEVEPETPILLIPTENNSGTCIFLTHYGQSHRLPWTCPGKFPSSKSVLLLLLWWGCRWPRLSSDGHQWTVSALTTSLISFPLTFAGFNSSNWKPLCWYMKLTYCGAINAALYHALHCMCQCVAEGAEANMVTAPTPTHVCLCVRACLGMRLTHGSIL